MDDDWLNNERLDDYRPPDYGEGKTREQEALDSAAMLAVVLLLAGTMVIGAAIGVALTLWLT